VLRHRQYRDDAARASPTVIHLMGRSLSMIMPVRTSAPNFAT
jgi:hypothetical protein